MIMWVTLYVTVIALAIGTILGILLGISRCSKNKILKYAPLIIIEPLRNSPLIVQLFLVYFGVPVLTGQVLPLYPAAIGTLALNTAAFMAVQVQTSILSIPRGQWEASLALGHSYASTYINVIAQQAIRILLPQAITLYISQLMCSSLVSLLGVMDLSRLAKFTATRTMTLDQLLRDPEIELVVNLTPPAVHFSVIEQALLAGKHVYTEKVIAPSCQEAARLAELARSRNLVLCAAPDTFLGDALQAARRTVDSGLLGTITSCHENTPQVGFSIPYCQTLGVQFSRCKTSSAVIVRENHSAWERARFASVRSRVRVSLGPPRRRALRSRKKSLVTGPVIFSAPCGGRRLPLKTRPGASSRAPVWPCATRDLSLQTQAPSRPVSPEG